MSAFLGHIHYWLYRKIRQVTKRQQMLTAAAAATWGEAAQAAQQAVSVMYGEPLPDVDLAELIDTRNIHGWLQQQIMLVETREAAYVNELCETYGAAAEPVILGVYAAHGRDCAAAAVADGQYELTSAGGLYQTLQDFFLNGMPCDNNDQVSEQSADSVRWAGPAWPQLRHWARGGADVSFMQRCYTTWLAAFIAGLNAEFGYRQTAEGQYHHQISRN